MTLEEAKTKDNLKAVIRIGIGKRCAIPAYVAGFAEYTVPDSATRTVAIVSDNLAADSITGDRPIVFTSYSELENAVNTLKSIKAKPITIIEI